MASNVTHPGFPRIVNPGEPFAYLPPDIGRELHNFQYVVSATTGMFVWELFYDLPNIYKLFITNRPTIPAVIYLVSRIAALLFNALTLQFLIVGGNCVGIYIALGVSWVFASACTSMLFFLRVRALYRDNIAVVGFFVFLWLCVIGGALTIPISNGKRVAHLLPGESFCITVGTFPGYAGSSIIIPAIFDTLVFIAISYRLYPSYEIEQHMTWKKRFDLFFTGQGLPRLSKALLQGGQQYYMMSVAANIFALTFYFTPSVPIPYHVMVTLILINLINSMACKVYRDVKFGRISATSVYSSSSNPRSALNTVPFFAAPRSKADVFVNMDVTTSGTTGSEVRAGSVEGIELPETPTRSFKPDVEIYGKV